MPARPYGSTADHTASHRVAPSARAASRWWFGTASSTSRQTALMYGRIMMARMMPAASIELPRKSPAKNGVQPSVAWTAGTTCRSNGIRTKIPQRPYTTLGIAASNSTRVPTGPRNHSGANSVR